MSGRIETNSLKLRPKLSKNWGVAQFAMQMHCQAEDSTQHWAEKARSPSGLNGKRPV
ncbi:hypothetical protein MACH17_40320 [Phaeobacter inhibens]|nr:hypothetical protein MACH17_40320 [Phaeobacter inhibens]